MAKVLSVILRLDGHHFAAPTQLLPSGGDPDECDDALQSFTEAMKVAGGTNQGQAVKLPAGSFSWKSYRQATKAVLAGLANSLVSLAHGTCQSASHPTCFLRLRWAAIGLQWLKWKR